MHVAFAFFRDHRYHHLFLCFSSRPTTHQFECRFCSLHSDGVINRAHNARAIKPFIKSVEISDDEDDLAAAAMAVSPQRAQVVDLVAAEGGVDGQAEQEELLDSYVGRRGTSSSRTARPRRISATPTQPSQSASSSDKDKKKVILCKVSVVSVYLRVLFASKVCACENLIMDGVFLASRVHSQEKDEDDDPRVTLWTTLREPFAPLTQIELRRLLDQDITDITRDPSFQVPPLGLAGVEDGFPGVFLCGTVVTWFLRLMFAWELVACVVGFIHHDLHFRLNHVRERYAGALIDSGPSFLFVSALPLQAFHRRICVPSNKTRTFCYAWDSLPRPTHSSATLKMWLSHCHRYPSPFKPPSMHTACGCRQVIWGWWRSRRAAMDPSRKCRPQQWPVPVMTCM